jgi:co-chaperonin GroES (HSP10)
MKEQLSVVGPRIKVLVDPPREDKSSGGIILGLGDKAEDNETGIVVQLGHLAYAGYSEKWCDLGDKILFQRYAGKPKEEMAADGTIRYYRVLKDIDVIGVLSPVEVKVEDKV